MFPHPGTINGGWAECARGGVGFDPRIGKEGEPPPLATTAAVGPPMKATRDWGRAVASGDSASGISTRLETVLWGRPRGLGTGQEVGWGQAPSFFCFLGSDIRRSGIGLGVWWGEARVRG